MDEVEQVVVAVTYSPEEDLFLLLKRADGKEYFPNKWEFPAGFLESGDIRGEALRELREETGLVGEVIREGESFEIKSDKNKEMIEVHPILVIVDYEGPELGREHTDHRWIDLDDLDELETVKGLKKDLKHVGVLDG